MALPARAADLPLKARPAPLEAPYDWTGFYIGGHASHVSVDKDWFAPNGTAVGSHSPNGFAGGAQAGFNWQRGGWVFGAEAQMTWSHLREGRTLTNQLSIQDGSSNTVFGDGSVRRGGTTVENIGTIAGRAGYAWNRWLGYVKGGAAWVHDVHRIFNTTVSPEVFDAGATVTRTGWMAGAGLEYGLTPNWSLKVEYNYMDFGGERIIFTRPAGTRFALDVDQQISLVKAGINYRFGVPAAIP